MDVRAEHSAEIDRALAAWRQGDCVLGDHWFVWRVDDPEDSLREVQVPGLVVVTQTCDIVRPCENRPFVELCPLVRVDASLLREVPKRPGYALVPGLQTQGLVADLDRVMTAEKAVVARWARVAGCTTDEQMRRFALALARKRERFAFPDDFSALARRFQRRFAEKHDKKTREGAGLRSIQEIRVQASPTWDADSVSLFFWFIRHPGEALAEAGALADRVDEWLALLRVEGRFTEVLGQVVGLEDMTAADYVGSDRLDLDHLSLSRE